MSEAKVTGIICVCEKCGHHQSGAQIEINFGDKCIYWPCTACKTMNSLSLPRPEQTPYPKSKRLRRG